MRALSEGMRRRLANTYELNRRCQTVKPIQLEWSALISPKCGAKPFQALHPKGLFKEGDFTHRVRRARRKVELNVLPPRIRPSQRPQQLEA